MWEVSEGISLLVMWDEGGGRGEMRLTLLLLSREIAHLLEMKEWERIEEARLRRIPLSSIHSNSIPDKIRQLGSPPRFFGTVPIRDQLHPRPSLSPFIVPPCLPRRIMTWIFPAAAERAGTSPPRNSDKNSVRIFYKAVRRKER
jgi:hypothetical protein